MSVVEELMAQRDAVMFGTWVGRYPVRAEEACLVVRQEYLHPQAKRPVASRARGLSENAIGVVCDVLRDRGVQVWRRPPAWNDQRSRKRAHVLDVLDEAIRRAKELESADSSSTAVEEK